MTHQERGNWMQTFTGRRIFPFSPRSEDVCIEDIAHSLAQQCRFTGHTHSFYSIAEHTVRGLLIAPSQLARAWFLHDAAEAYIHDLSSEIKHYAGDEDPMAWYRRVEADIWQVMRVRFSLSDSPGIRRTVKEADEQVRIAEMRRFLPQTPRIVKEIDGREGYWAVAVAWSQEHAENTFLWQFQQLFKEPIPKE